MPIIKAGTKITITGYAQHTTIMERLRELGLVVGTTVTVLRRAPFNGPVELQYGRSRLAVRPEDMSAFVWAAAA